MGNSRSAPPPQAYPMGGYPMGQQIPPGAKPLGVYPGAHQTPRGAKPMGAYPPAQPMTGGPTGYAMPRAMQWVVNRLPVKYTGYICGAYNIAMAARALYNLPKTSTQTDMYYDSIVAAISALVGYTCINGVARSQLSSVNIAMVCSGLLYLLEAIGKPAIDLEMERVPHANEPATQFSTWTTGAARPLPLLVTSYCLNAIRSKFSNSPPPTGGGHPYTAVPTDEPRHVGIPQKAAYQGQGPPAAPYPGHMPLAHEGIPVMNGPPPVYQQGGYLAPPVPGGPYPPPPPSGAQSPRAAKSKGFFGRYSKNGAFQGYQESVVNLTD